MELSRGREKRRKERELGKVNISTSERLPANICATRSRGRVEGKGREFERRSYCIVCRDWMKYILYVLSVRRGCERGGREVGGGTTPGSERRLCCLDSPSERIASASGSSPGICGTFSSLSVCREVGRRVGDGGTRAAARAAHHREDPGVKFGVQT